MNCDDLRVKIEKSPLVYQRNGYQHINFLLTRSKKEVEGNWGVLSAMQSVSSLILIIKERK